MKIPNYIKFIAVVFVGLFFINTSVKADTNFSEEEEQAIKVVDTNNNIITPVIYDDIVDNAEELSNYFYVRNDGSIGLNISQEELEELLEISPIDAQYMLESLQYLPNSYSRGPVGIRFNLGPKVRSMSGWAAGTFAAAYAGWYLKQLAVNPTTAGIAAVITGAVGWTVKTAVENHQSTTLAVVYIPGVNLVYNVNVP